MLALSIIPKTCSQELKNTLASKSCSTTMESKQRLNSIMIVKSISSKYSGITSFKQCARLCFDTGAPTCLYFGFQLSSKMCLFFKGNLNNEAISRLIFEKWRYGRVTASKMVCIKISFRFRSNLELQEAKFWFSSFYEHLISLDGPCLSLRFKDSYDALVRLFGEVPYR